MMFSRRRQRSFCLSKKLTAKHRLTVIAVTFSTVRHMSMHRQIAQSSPSQSWSASTEMNAEERRNVRSTSMLRIPAIDLLIGTSSALRTKSVEDSADIVDLKVVFLRDVSHQCIDLLAVQVNELAALLALEVIALAVFYM